MFNANSFKIFCWLPLLAACQSPAAALPHGETSETVALDAKHHVAVQRYCAGPPIAGVLFYQPHENEATARRATLDVLAARGQGCLLVLNHDGGRQIHFEAAGRPARFDPNRIYTAAGRAATIEFLRDGVIHTASVTSTYDAELHRHLIGIQFNTLADLDYTTRVHPTPWAQVRDHAGGIFRCLSALTTPATSGAAAGAVGGPVLILVMLWLMVKSSFSLAIWFTGFLNVNLAIINLLPLPLLDGGHVIFNLWEMATRRPVPAKWIHALTNLFVVLFIGVFLLLVYRDSVRHIIPGLHRWWTDAPDPAPHVFQTPPGATEDSPSASTP